MAESLGERVLVTGAGGFIGARLSQRLQGQGLRVVGLSRRPGGGVQEWHAVELGREPVPCAALEGVHTVYHLAARVHHPAHGAGDEEPYRRVNVQGTRELLEACRRAGVQRFVYLSSVKALGEGQGRHCVDDGAEPRPVSAYGRSKRQAEELVLDGGFVSHPVVLRPPLVYGPRSAGNLKRLITAIRRGHVPPLGGVANRRSMVHVEDLVTVALAVAVDARAAGQAYLVSDGRLYSTGEIYRRVRAQLGRPSMAFSTPRWLLYGAARTGDLMEALSGRAAPLNTRALNKLLGSECYDSSRLWGLLGLRPRYTLWDALPGMVEETLR